MMEKRRTRLQRRDRFDLVQEVDQFVHLQPPAFKLNAETLKKRCPTVNCDFQKPLGDLHHALIVVKLAFEDFSLLKQFVNFLLFLFPQFLDPGFRPASF